MTSASPSAPSIVAKNAAGRPLDDESKPASKEQKRRQTMQGERASLLRLRDAPRDFTGASATLRNFITMSALFSAVPAAALACLSLATARLGSVGAWQSGVLYLAYTLSAVMGATYVVKRLGSRNAMILGMTFFCMYVGAFLIATVWPSTLKVAALTGAAIGGIGSGLLWTAQGVYFSQASEEYSLKSGQDWASSTSMMAGIFAFILLAEETALDLLSTFLIRVFGVPWDVIFALYAGIAVVATSCMVYVKEYPIESSTGGGASSSSSSFASILYKVTAAFRLLVTDSKLKYMIGLNAVFGFAGAFLNSFVSGEVVPVALRDTNSSYVGLLVAIHGGVAAICSLGFGQLSQTVGKGPILVLGALSFAGVAIPFLIRPDLEEWTWGLLIMVYAFQGMGRATFEGTLKATFADYFPYEKEGAFANIILQNGLSSAAAYVVSFRLSCSHPSTYCIEYRDGSLHDIFSFGLMVVLTACFAILGYWRASIIFAAGEGNEELSVYRSSSIASYRNSRVALSVIDRRTYDALATTIAVDDEGMIAAIT
jgi:MFS family permease